MMLLKMVKKIQRNPLIIKEAGRYALNDLFALLGVYRYPYRILFIAGLPKSGTTWLSTMLAMVPGYNIGPISDPDGVVLDGDVSDSVFSVAARSGYRVLKLHTRYSEQNLAVIFRHVDKFVIMYRDLRDMCISRYEHIKADPTHRHHDLYSRMNPDDGLAHSIQVVADAYVSWVRDWMNMSGQLRDRILTVRYELLVDQTERTLKQVLNFYRLPADEGFIASLAATKLTQERNLVTELEKSVGGRLQSTARKGKVGQWKEVLTPGHRDRFKEIAGDLLIELGYEQNHDW